MTVLLFTILSATLVCNTNQPGDTKTKVTFVDSYNSKEHSGPVVECLNRDRGAAGSSLTGVTVLCPEQDTFIFF